MHACMYMYTIFYMYGFLGPRPLPLDNFNSGSRSPTKHVIYIVQHLKLKDMSEADWTKESLYKQIMHCVDEF